MILHLPLEIWQQLQCYVKAALPNEITGIGAISVKNPEEVVVTELFLPQQIATVGACHFTKGELGKIISNFVRNNPARAGDLCFRWHSHGYGNTFWSSIDENDIGHWKGDYVFNLVTNADGAALVRLDLFRPFRHVNIAVNLQIDYPALDDGTAKVYTSEVQKRLISPIDDSNLEPLDPALASFLRK